MKAGELTIAAAAIAIRKAERTIEQTILDLKKQGIPVTDIEITRVEAGFLLRLHCEIEPEDGP
jgi:hypothetical protein